MRSVGLGALVAAVIFAAAFGVYFWLLGDPERRTEVAEATPAAATQAGGDTGTPGDSGGNTAVQGSAAVTQEPAASETPDEAPASGSEPSQAQNTRKAESQETASPAAEPAAQKPKSESNAEPSQAQVLQSQQPDETPSSDKAPADKLPAVSGVVTGLSPAEKKPEKPRTPQVVARSETNTQSLTPSQPEKKPAGEAPSFDVVRVEKTGEAILAGRAPAGSEVTVYDGDTPLGIVKADSRGQWVLILDIPLRPGSHSLGITARRSDDTLVESAELVIVAVPEPPRPDAPARQLAEATSAASQPAADPLSEESDEAPVDLASSDDITRQPAATGDEATEAASSTAPDTEEATDSPVAPSQVAAADTGVEEPIAVVVPRHGTGPTRILQQPELVDDGIGDGSLFLDSVDYDDEGRAVIGGRAAPGASLIIYLDNLPIGEALTDDDGRWVMTPENLVPVGLHQLRVDQIESGGRVLARVETPFSRADTVASHPDESFVTVQPGNSLWRIARAAYGRGTRYTVIYESNKSQIRDPDLIYPGQIFRLPSDG